MKKRLLVVVLALVFVLGVGATPALAIDGGRPWCGATYTQGYWKNHVECPSWEGWNIKAPKDGDYMQIFANQAIAFHYNWLLNDKCNCCYLQEARYCSGGMHPDWDGKTIAQIHAAAEWVLENGWCNRCQVLELKDVLEDVNEGYNVWCCTPVS